MTIDLSGWGRFPTVQSKPFFLKDSTSLSQTIARNFRGIAFGMGRSYGDSALSERAVLTQTYNHFLGFDTERGLLHVQAGTTLKEILDVIVPKGWFLPVTPGTQFVTFGGAIASDIHGKNHHKEGSFCDHVNWYRLMLPSGGNRYLLANQKHRPLSRHQWRNGTNRHHSRRRTSLKANSKRVH